MARLTAAQRRRLKPSQFAVPELREYPIPDLRHVGLAKGRLKQFGHLLTPRQRARAWRRIAAAEIRLLRRRGQRSSSSRAIALHKLSPTTILQLKRANLLRYFR